MSDDVFRAHGPIDVERLVPHDPLVSLRPLPPNVAGLLLPFARVWVALVGLVIVAWLLGEIPWILALVGLLVTGPGIVVAARWMRARQFVAWEVGDQALLHGTTSIPYSVIATVTTEPVTWRETDEATPRIEHAVVLHRVDGRLQALLVPDLPTADEVVVRIERWQGSWVGD